MVTILSLGFTELSGIAQERCTSPLICTEHAPHCATPHPYFVPVSPICSRITQSSGVSLAAVTSMCLPFTLSFAMFQFLLPVHHTMASRHRGHYNCFSSRPMRDLAHLGRGKKKGGPGSGSALVIIACRRLALSFRPHAGAFLLGEAARGSLAGRVDRLGVALGAPTDCRHAGPNRRLVEGSNVASVQSHRARLYPGVVVGA